ncbi:venom acid phosphatase Acph-1 [Calliopsis andreniformis]|uniref:venom acid phosphatase Acph-1 n=1 Tax=Calliopsis andreniformis TaxID=337506 RepID=UPI003FCDA2E5
MLPRSCREIYFKGLLFLISFLQLQQGYSKHITSQYNVELVQVLFRHGDRTPRKSELYPKLPFNASIYDPHNLGQLTDMGLYRAYNLGKMLRDKYDNFLSSTPRPGEVVAVSTDVDRTKMTLQLVIAGLYPSHPPCKSGSWKPIPMSYAPLIVDSLLMPQPCSLYMQEYKRVRNLPEVNRQVAKYEKLFEVVGENTGLDMSSAPVTAVFNTYQLLSSLKSMDIRLPKWVTPKILTEMKEVVAFGYELLNYSKKLQRLTGGVTIKKFIENMNLDGRRSNAPKIYLYSAHDLNIASFAKASGFKEPAIPNYGSTIAVEKLRDKAGAIFVRLQLWTGVTEKWITYTLPGCDEVCPVNKYVDLMKDVIPTEEELDCLWDAVTKDQLRKYYDK